MSRSLPPRHSSTPIITTIPIFNSPNPVFSPDLTNPPPPKTITMTPRTNLAFKSGPKPIRNVLVNLPTQENYDQLEEGILLFTNEPLYAIKLSKELFRDRKHAIRYCFFIIYNSPPPHAWPLVIRDIMVRLRIPAGNYSGIKKSFVEFSKPDYEFESSDKKKRIRKHIIGQGSEEENIICKAIESCLSIKQITCIVNESRASRGLSTISWSCIQNFVMNSPFIVRYGRLLVIMGQLSQMKFALTIK